jgi:hypothetical protein
MTGTDIMTLAQARDRFSDRYSKLWSTGCKYFRDYLPEARQEAVTNAMALAWTNFCLLVSRGMATDKLLTSTFHFALKQTRAGRMTKVVKHSRFRELFDHERRTGHAIVRGLNWELFVDPRDDVPTIVSFKVDTPAWIDSLPDIQRKRALDLATGASGKDLAKRWNCSAPRVTQIRNELAKSYHDFMSK